MKLSARQIRWLARPLALFVRVLGRSWRVRTHGFPEVRPQPEYIESFWHGDMLHFIYLYRYQTCVSMVSEHRDGELIAEVVQHLGGLVARGSSTRGGARAYLEMLKRYQGYGWVVTPDGPRGPRGSVHEGIIKLASDSGRAIRPHGYASAFARRLDSWDAFTIPLPFSRIVEYVGEPLRVPAKIDRASRKELARELERRLVVANQQASAALAQWQHGPAPALQGEHDLPPRA